MYVGYHLFNCGGSPRNIAALVFHMVVKLINICDNLLHCRVGLAYACALVHYAAFDTLDVGGNLIDGRGGFGHVARKIIADIAQV